MEGTETAEHKTKYFKAKKKARRRTVYQAKCRTERKRPGNVMSRDDEEYDVFKFAKRMIKTNENIIGEQCIRNDDDVLTVCDNDTKIAWKSYLKKLFNT